MFQVVAFSYFFGSVLAGPQVSDAPTLLKALALSHSKATPSAIDTLHHVSQNLMSVICVKICSYLSELVYSFSLSFSQDYVYATHVIY